MVESVMPAACISSRRSSYAPCVDQPSVMRMMWRSVAGLLMRSS
jgi:hypothetical protein